MILLKAKTLVRYNIRMMSIWQTLMTDPHSNHDMHLRPCLDEYVKKHLLDGYITIFVKGEYPDSEYCNKTLNLLSEHELKFNKVDIQEFDEIHTLIALQEQTKQITLPMIFLGDEHIGGYHDLLKLVEEESFHPMIAKFKIQD